MKKIVLILLLVLSSCTASPKTKESLKILSPTGAPAVSLIQQIEEGKNTVDLVSGPDNLQAALVNENSEYDVVIAPLNLGANLISQDKTKYQLYGLVTWGNLFLVKNKDDVKKIAAFGEAAVPGLIFKSLQDELNLKDIEVQWVPSVSEAQALLLTDQVDAALLAQPLVAATMAKAKQEQKELTIMANLQEAYKELNGVEDYPQAALFVSKDMVDNYKGQLDELFNSMKTYVEGIKSNHESFIKSVETITAEKLGIPNGQLVVNAFDQMGIKLEKAIDKQEEINSFLQLFKLNLDNEHIIK